MNRKLLALFAVIVAACTSYTGDSGPSAGEVGGACYPNRTCNAGVVCEGGTCKIAGSVADAAGSDQDGFVFVDPDAGTISDSGNTGSDASDAAKPAACDVTPSGAPGGVVDCVNVSCINNNACCGINHQCTANCVNPVVAMPCDGPEDCGNNMRCCGNLGTKIMDPVCPRTGAFTKLVTHCAVVCGADDLELCTDKACPGGARCTRVEVHPDMGSVTTFAIGYCE